MDGIAQAESQHLRLLFSGQSKEKEPSKQWFITQLHLYGIPYSKSDLKSVLKEALGKAFKAGKCDELTPSVAAVRDRLRKEYDDAFNRLEDKFFDEITGGPSGEAYADPSRFVKKYFLDAQGQPDRERTKEPLSLAVPQSYQQDLADVVEAVPGLAMTTTVARAIVGWDSTMRKGIENEFARLETSIKTKELFQSGQANTDWKFFLNKYLFVNIDAGATTPDPKPFVPVALERFSLDNRNLPEEIMAKVPGLLLKDYKQNYGRVAIIGWDAANIDNEIARLKEDDRREREKRAAQKKADEEEEEADKKARWDRRCKGYYELVAKQHQRPNPLGLQHLPGSYIVRWNEKHAEGYGHDPYDESDMMRINIFPPEGTHGVTASFNFCLIEGPMLLAMSRRSVEILREEQPKHSSYSEHDDSDPDEDDDDYGGGDRSPCSKCKPKGKVLGEKRPIGEISDPFGVLAARAKRQKTTTEKQEEAPPNRVYFQFVCSEVNGYPEVDDHNEHVGHLDFDETGLAANGVYHYPGFFGQNQPQLISIFKVSEMPDSTDSPQPWYEYDGRRWGSW